eukprot:4903222-Amphidinium_carterae.2
MPLPHILCTDLVIVCMDPFCCQPGDDPTRDTSAFPALVDVAEHLHWCHCWPGLGYWGMEQLMQCR